jgi:ABC-type antimicrobial peptide transport system ATPase subunit
MPEEPIHLKGAPLLDIRDLKIEATVYPPDEDPHDITIVDGVSLTLHKGKVLGLIGESCRPWPMAGVAFGSPAAKCWSTVATC